MALDHYVPQVHLRQFLSPALGGRQLYGIRKRDGLKFPCGTKAICRIQEGNTNDFLVDPGMIEEFLRLVEPKYPIALDEISKRRISSETIFVISGFISSITSCAPAAVRLNTARTKHVLDDTAKVIDRQGLIPPAPESLGGKSLTELLDSGVIHMTVDEKFPQAIAIAGVLPKLSMLGNAHWEIFLNSRFSPFFTSDFPVAVQWRGGLFSRIVPLSPAVALRLTCDPAQ